MSKAALISVLVGGLVAGAALAHEGATGIIAERMKAMENMGRELKVMIGMVDGEGPLDRAAFLRHAEAFHEDCHRVEAMFPPGSIDHHSHALPAIWERPDEFQEEMRRLHEASEELVAIAASADSATLHAAFDEIKDTCTSCHEAFRKPED
jgi:cytochrome c556